MGTFILAKIPDSNIARSITADQFPLVRMNYNIIHWRSMAVVSLHVSGSCIPDLNGTIFGARDHPLAFAVKCNAGDIVTVAFKGDYRGRVC